MGWWHNSTWRLSYRKVGLLNYYLHINQTFPSRESLNLLFACHITAHELGALMIVMALETWIILIPRTYSNGSSFHFSNLLSWPSFTSGNFYQFIFAEWWVVGKRQAQNLHGCLHLDLKNLISPLWHLGVIKRLGIVEHCGAFNVTTYTDYLTTFKSTNSQGRSAFSMRLLTSDSFRIFFDTLSKPFLSLCLYFSLNFVLNFPKEPHI